MPISQTQSTQTLHPSIFGLHLLFDPKDRLHPISTPHPGEPMKSERLMDYCLLSISGRYCRWQGVLEGSEHCFKRDPGAITHSKTNNFAPTNPSIVQVQRPKVKLLWGNVALVKWDIDHLVSFPFVYRRFKKRKNFTCLERFNQGVPKSILFKEIVHFQNFIFYLLIYLFFLLHLHGLTWTLEIVSIMFYV